MVKVGQHVWANFANLQEVEGIVEEVIHMFNTEILIKVKTSSKVFLEDGFEIKNVFLHLEEINTIQ